MKLFDPIIDEAKLHPNFKSTMGSTNEPERNEFLRWAEGFPDRDGKFVKQFQETFNSSFWEVYLYAVFKEYGFDFDWNHSSPDFNVTADNHNFIVEATTANSAVGKLNEWEKKHSPGELKNIKFNELNSEAIIRLSNSIIGKSKYFKQKYAKLEHVKNKPFILAIAPFEQPNFNLQYNRPIMALLYNYYVDEDAYLKDPELYPEGPPTKELDFVEKDNGAEIPLGIFLDDQYSEISAVIFSCTATWGKLDAMVNNPEVYCSIQSIWATEPDGVPEARGASRENHQECLTDGLQIYHNPFAKYPLPVETFKRKGVTQCFPDVAKKIFFEEEATRCLLYRQSFKLVSSTE